MALPSRESLSPQPVTSPKYWFDGHQERMSRRRRRRSVQLVKTCSSPSHLLVYNNFIPYMEDLCGTASKSASSSTTMAAQRPICISHLLSSVSQNPYNCVRNGLLPYKVKFWRCEGLLLVLGGACGVGRSFAAFGGSCAPAVTFTAPSLFSKYYRLMQCSH